MSDRPNAVMQFFQAAQKDPTMIKVGAAPTAQLCSPTLPWQRSNKPLMLAVMLSSGDHESLEQDWEVSVRLGPHIKPSDQA